jgi:hypothetical protein
MTKMQGHPMDTSDDRLQTTRAPQTRHALAVAGLLGVLGVGAAGQAVAQQVCKYDSIAAPAALGAGVNGSLEVGGDADYFALTVTARGLLTVSTSGFIDTAGVLLDGSGAELVSADGGGAGGNFALTYAVVPGTYYVRVQGGSPSTTGVYTLTSALSPASSGSDFDADRKADLLWRHAVTGDNAIWLMDWTDVKTGSFITPVPDTGWEVRQ